MLKGFTRNFKPLEILTDEQVQAIHRGTLDVLETTGVRVEHDRALQLFADHGCKVDLKEKRVRIPGYLVEDCLRKCPSSFAVKARDPKYDLRIGGNNLYFKHGMGMRYLDLDTWQSRSGTLQEHAEAVRILDALGTVHMLATGGFYVEMEDIPPCMGMLEGLASGIRNSVKTSDMGPPGSDCEVFAIKMANAVGMQLRGGVDISAPLTYSQDTVEAVLRFTEAGFPTAIMGCAQFGVTGPATIAGSTITNNAEILAGLVLMQLFRPGVGVMAGDFGYPMDIRFGHPAFGAVEAALHKTIHGQVWRCYGVPTSMAQDGYSSSKKIDFQNGYERAMSALLSALVGGDLSSLHGSVHAMLTYNPILSILDDDIAGWVGRFIEGVEVTDETLAIDLIEQVGPIPGQYLNTEHTRKWWQKEQFIPKAADRAPYPEWLKKGKKDAIALAKERMTEILAKHEPRPLTPEQDKAIDEILEEARSFYRQKGLM